MAVKVTLVPEQIVLFVALDEMLTLAVTLGVTVTITGSLVVEIQGFLDSA